MLSINRVLHLFLQRDRSLLFSLAIVMICSFSIRARAEVVDRIVALVNDSVITLSELEELTIPLQMRIQTMSRPAWLTTRTTGSGLPSLRLLLRTGMRRTSRIVFTISA